MIELSKKERDFLDSRMALTARGAFAGFSILLLSAGVLSRFVSDLDLYRAVAVIVLPLTVGGFVNMAGQANTARGIIKKLQQHIQELESKNG